jgi:hypothetical protein
MASPVIFLSTILPTRGFFEWITPEVVSYERRRYRALGSGKLVVDKRIFRAIIRTLVLKVDGEPCTG